MDMSNFRPELHVAQQSRRDKLRVHQNSEAYSHHFGQLPTNQELNSEFIQVRNVRYANLPYDGTMFPSEMLNFSTNSQIILPAEDGSCANPTTTKVSGGPQNTGTWKNVGSPQCFDLITNYSSGSRGMDQSSQNPMFVGEGLSGSLKPINISSTPLYMKSYDEIRFTSPIYQNTLQDVVQQNMGDTSRGSWGDGGNELLLPDQSNTLRFDNGELGYQGSRSVSNTQGLSLSLSSVPSAKTHLGQYGDKYGSDLPESKTLNSDCVYSNPEQSIGTKMIGNTRQDVGISNLAHRSTGPLGPFTGYATILKNSKFLNPAQQLLDEFCSQIGPKITRTLETRDKISEEVRLSAYSVDTVESIGGTKGGHSGGSSSTFRSSNGISGELGVGSRSSETYGTEYQQNKAKLLYMHEEVCKRFKQYHQQMQMVVSSFESVAGLSRATPYISYALKMVARHFRSLKNAISDQLSYIRKAMGEDLSSPTTGTSSYKGDTSTVSRMNFVDSGFQKQKSCGGNFGGYFEPQQHVWRPQRGLPERAVAVLRAWLFDHFLHPYPTDTDKHMLATQTGLSRNQVSNWFINARVRVWKPMVEEIHTLETKGLAAMSSNLSKYEEKSYTDQPTNRLGIVGMSNNQVECSGIGEGANQWNQEKRSRMEFEAPVSMDDPVVGFVPYQRGGLEIGGLGTVSLTLGLRQSPDGAKQQQELQEQRVRQQFGGQMIHDFVG